MAAALLAPNLVRTLRAWFRLPPHRWSREPDRGAESAVAHGAERAGPSALVMPGRPGEGCGARGGGAAGGCGEGEQTTQEFFGLGFFFWGGVGLWSLGFFLAHLRASPGNSEYSGHRRQRGGFTVSLLYVLIYSAAVS